MTKKRKSEGPGVVLLYCQHTVQPDENVTAAAEKAEGCELHAELMPCSSRVQVSHLLKIFEKGADGIELVACPQDKCRVQVGNRKAEQRVEQTRKLLQKNGVEPERIGLTRTEPLSAEQLVALGCACAKKVGALGAG